MLSIPRNEALYACGCLGSLVLQHRLRYARSLKETIPWVFLTTITAQKVENKPAPLFLLKGQDRGCSLHLHGPLRDLLFLLRRRLVRDKPQGID